MPEHVPPQILSLWNTHREAPWPTFTDPNQGQLMTLDTVISGCVTYYLEASTGLDAQRIEILRSCEGELNALLPELTPDVREYFSRLSNLASLLLQDARR